MSTFLETRVILRYRDGTQPDETLAVLEQSKADWLLITRALGHYGRPHGEIRARARALREKIETEIAAHLPEELGA